MTNRLGPYVPALMFFGYVMAAYAVAALLCVPFGESVAGALGVPTHKFIGRGGLLFAILGGWWLLKMLGIADRRRLGYGVSAAHFRRSLVRGFGAGVAILACLSLALLVLDIRVPPIAGEPPLLVKVLAQGLLGGIAVGFIEETFFRGAMFSAVRQRGGGAVTAICLTALIYSVLHFIKPQPFPPGAEIDLWTCLSSVGGSLPALFRWENFDSAAALFLVGVFLGVVRLRTGHIGWCIGLHAGWVFVIKLTQKYSHVDPEAPYRFLVGTYDGIIGWLAAAWIGALALVLALWPRNGGAESYGDGAPAGH